jgi:hypothetical protein
MGLPFVPCLTELDCLTVEPMPVAPDGRASHAFSPLDHNLDPPPRSLPADRRRIRLQRPATSLRCGLARTALQTRPSRRLRVFDCPCSSFFPRLPSWRSVCGFYGMQRPLRRAWRSSLPRSSRCGGCSSASRERSGRSCSDSCGSQCPGDVSELRGEGALTPRTLIAFGVAIAILVLLCFVPLSYLRGSYLLPADKVHGRLDRHGATRDFSRESSSSIFRCFGFEGASGSFSAGSI